MAWFDDTTLNIQSISDATGRLRIEGLARCAQFRVVGTISCLLGDELETSVGVVAGQERFVELRTTAGADSLLRLRCRVSFVEQPVIPAD